jgi:hypothetical protein
MLRIQRRSTSPCPAKFRNACVVWIIILIAALKAAWISFFQGQPSLHQLNASVVELTGEMYNPKHRDGLNENIPQDSFDSLIIDIMSVGSKTRMNYLETQRATFGSHKSVRYFFNITEDDDADPHCAENFGPKDSIAVANFCRNKVWHRRQFLMRYLRTRYAKIPWLKKKASPHGWMCAQTRPSHGLHKVLSKYRESSPINSNSTIGSNLKREQDLEPLPDYLIVIDDDTFVNVKLVHQYLATYDSSTPKTIAGCLIRSPIQKVNFTLPYGGYGTIFSRGKLFVRNEVYLMINPSFSNNIMW